MFMSDKMCKFAVAASLFVGLSAGAFAQETTSSIKGNIVGPEGNPATGTEVVVTHVPTGTARTATVDASGNFSLSGLRVGGPYEVTLDSRSFDNAVVSDIFLKLGEPANINYQMESLGALDTIQVTATQISSYAFGQTGPSSVFGREELENAPAINRDIKDIIRIDPRIYIDESFSDGVQCAGASPRFNSVTLDGIRLNDNFGLNSNGYPTESMPFSYGVVEQVAVELAPFDVEYGGFTACNINAVTKSGTNELSGSVFFDYTSDSFAGDEIEGNNIDIGDYTEERYGFNVGAPIIKDKLFIFGAYEKREGIRLHNYNFSRVAQEELEEIAQISRDLYGYDPGGFKPSSPVEDEKIFVKLDWNINDQHRASLSYNWNDGFNISESDLGSTRIPFDGHFYERGAEIETYVGSLFSDWSHNFSTELRIGHTSLDNRQNSVDADTGFGEVQVRVPGGATVYLGPDDSRQANQLNWDNLTVKLAGTYYVGDHAITGGVEYEDLDIFNLFMQHRIGEYRFRSIEDFRLGLADRIYYNNAAGTNNPNDVAASFSFDTTTFYVQDEWYVNPYLTVLLGARYDEYGSNDRPRFNQAFADFYGFDNTANLDGKDLFQPRVGFNYAFRENLEFRGGFGLYSGGNPNVWVSNAYSNDGVTQVFAREDDIDGWVSGESSIFDLPRVGNGPVIVAPPQELFDYVASRDTDGFEGFTVALDPDFEIPSEWKYALGLTYLAPMDFLVQADLLYTDKVDAPTYIEPSRTVESVLFDGRPVYSGSNSTFLLTNVEGDSGDAVTFSISASKEWDFGLDMSLAYAYNDSTDVNPMTSSVAGSNYRNFATVDPNNPGAETSNYNIPHRFTLLLGYQKEFFDGYSTRFTLFGSANEGRGMSYTYGDDFDDFVGDGRTGGGRQLIYVPEIDDPNVIYADGFDVAAFDAFIASEGLKRGRIMDRNSVHGDWWTKFDLRVSQELPGFSKDHRASAFVVLENVGNFLNDDWGVLKQGNFVSESVVDATVNENGQYVYNTFFGADQRENIQRGPSLWEMRIGLSYRF